MEESEKIKIMSSLQFDFNDLMRIVDFSHPFTLRDILKISVNSKIPVEILGYILRCPYIEDYLKEAESKPFSDDMKIEYLEVYWIGDESKYKGECWSVSSWGFHGAGYLNDYSDDIKEYYLKNLRKELPKNYRENYAIEFSPLYRLADYKIKVMPKMTITRHDKEFRDETVDFTPSITLIELLYAIFWELSFCGSPKERDEMNEELKDRVDEIDKAKEEGRLDEITTSHEKVKERLQEKFGEEGKEDGL